MLSQSPLHASGNLAQHDAPVKDCVRALQHLDYLLHLKKQQINRLKSICLSFPPRQCHHLSPPPLFTLLVQINTHFHSNWYFQSEKGSEGKRQYQCLDVFDDRASVMCSCGVLGSACCVIGNVALVVAVATDRMAIKTLQCDKAVTVAVMFAAKLTLAFLPLHHFFRFCCAVTKLVLHAFTAVIASSQNRMTFCLLFSDGSFPCFRVSSFMFWVHLIRTSSNNILFGFFSFTL